MKQNTTQNRPSRLLAGAFGLAALIAVGLPQSAEAANTTAKTKIVNLVTVTYADSTGTETYSKTAYASVEVNLVPSAPNAYGVLTAAGKPTDAAFGCVNLAFNMGDTAKHLYAVVATANGSDDYTLGVGNTTVSGTPDTVTATYNSINSAGTSTALDDGNTLPLGSAVPVGVDSGDSKTLLFPGGTLQNITDGDIVVVEYADGSKHLFLADGDAIPGTAPTDDPAQEDQGTLKLKAYADQTINGLALGGGSEDPDFSANPPKVGSVVAEMTYVEITVKVTDATAGADAEIKYTVSFSDSAATPNTTTLECTCAFAGTGLDITKEVRVYDIVAATWSAWDTTALKANPGDILEYRLTITNTGGDATDVTVNDAVPAYTKLLTFSAGNYGDNTDGVTDHSKAIFAYDNGNSVELTTGAIDENADNVSGEAAGSAAADDLYFYVGAGQDGSSQAGGTLVDTDTFTILYQVQID